MKSDSNLVKMKINNLGFEIKENKKFEFRLNQLSLFWVGLIGEELGMTSGEIKNDQITVSDASDPSLSLPRIGLSTWNPLRSKNV